MLNSISDGKLLVTGASGFVGMQLAKRLLTEGASILAAVRTPAKMLSLPSVTISTFDLESPERFDPRQFHDVSCVVHLAAQVHITRPTRRQLVEFEAKNAAATERFARMAAANGVGRFVFVSSIKVNGEATYGRPFREYDSAAPSDPYAASKAAAEHALVRIAEEARMEVVILRPPLVYGPGVRGNFLSLMKWLNSGLPLPVLPERNSRSLVAVENLVEAIRLCISHPDAGNDVFLISDDSDLSTKRLVEYICNAMEREPRFLPFSPRFLRVLLKLSGKHGLADRLVGSLQVDVSHIKQRLGWEPVVDVPSAIQTTVEAFLAGTDK